MDFVGPPFGFFINQLPRVLVNTICIVYYKYYMNIWPIPVVMQNMFSMGSVKSLLEEKIPGVYVHSLMIGKY